MDEILIELQQLSTTLAELKKRISDFENAQYFSDWVPRKTLMEFLNYGDTQMAALLKDADLIVSEIGNRKFIRKNSVIKLLEKHVKKSS